MVDLGTPGGLDSGAVAIDGEQIVGDTWTGFSVQPLIAFSWTATGGTQYLGTLGGPTSTAVAVDAGQVVGRADTADPPFFGANIYHAFSWTTAGGIVDLGTLPGFPFSGAAAVSNGQVVGRSCIYDFVKGPQDGNQCHAFSWTQAGGMVDLGTLGGSSWASGVSGGLVVGSFLVGPSGSYVNGFRWTQAGGMVDISNPADLSNANGVDNGQVVGFIGSRAFSWTATGGTISLNPQGSDAMIVRNGQVAGEIPGFGGSFYHAALWLVPPP
jgi:probable HAF family extracellular repeat protein